MKLEFLAKVAVLAMLPFTAFAASGTPVSLSSHGTPVVCTNCALTPASSTNLGGVKVGQGLSAAPDGTVSVTLDLSPYLTTTAADGRYLSLSGGTVDGNVTVNGHVNLTTQGYIFISSNNPDSNNNDAKIFFDTDNTLYTTNIGSGASHYMTSKFDNLRSVVLTGTGNAVVCTTANGTLYRGTNGACQ